MDRDIDFSKCCSYGRRLMGGKPTARERNYRLYPQFAR